MAILKPKQLNSKYVYCMQFHPSFAKITVLFSNKQEKEQIMLD